MISLKNLFNQAMLFLSVLRRQRLTPRFSRRGYRNSNKLSSKPSTNDTKKSVEIDERHLNWKDRKEAPKWLSRMAPTKGGTKLPTPLEAAVIAVVTAVGYYAWFVEPPKRAEEAEGQR